MWRCDLWRNPVALKKFSRLNGWRITTCGSFCVGTDCGRLHRQNASFGPSQRGRDRARVSARGVAGAGPRQPAAARSPCGSHDQRVPGPRSWPAPARAGPACQAMPGPHGPRGVRPPLGGSARCMLAAPLARAASCASMSDCSGQSGSPLKRARTSKISPMPISRDPEICLCPLARDAGGDPVDLFLADVRGKRGRTESVVDVERQRIAVHRIGSGNSRGDGAGKREQVIRQLRIRRRKLAVQFGKNRLDDLLLSGNVTH